MNEHDVVHVIDTPGDAVVSCACGRSFAAPSIAQARADHDHHFGLEGARAALKGERT